MKAVEEIAQAIEAEATKGQEPAEVRYFEQYPGQSIDEIDELRFNITKPEHRFKLYTTPQSCPKCSELEAKKKLPPPELTWIYTHCRAIGMTCKSDSGKWEEDIALWTINLTERIKELEAERDALAMQVVSAKDVAVSAIKRMRAAHVNRADLILETEKLLALPNYSDIIKRHDAEVLRKAANSDQICTDCEKSLLMFVAEQEKS